MYFGENGLKRAGLRMTVVESRVRPRGVSEWQGNDLSQHLTTQKLGHPHSFPPVARWKPCREGPVFCNRLLAVGRPE